MLVEEAANKGRDYGISGLNSPALRAPLQLLQEHQRSVLIAPDRNVDEQAGLKK